MLRSESRTFLSFSWPSLNTSDFSSYDFKKISKLPKTKISARKKRRLPLISMPSSISTEVFCFSFLGCSAFFSCLFLSVYSTKFLKVLRRNPRFSFRLNTFPIVPNPSLTALKPFSTVARC